MTTTAASTRPTAYRALVIKQLGINIPGNLVPALKRHVLLFLLVAVVLRHPRMNLPQVVRLVVHVVLRRGSRQRVAPGLLLLVPLALLALLILLLVFLPTNRNALPRRDVLPHPVQFCLGPLPPEVLPHLFRRPLRPRQLGRIHQLGRPLRLPGRDHSPSHVFNRRVPPPRAVAPLDLLLVRIPKVIKRRQHPQPNQPIPLRLDQLQALLQARGEMCVVG